MKKPILFIVLSCICLEINFSQNTFASTPVVLVFTKTKGYRHASIPSGVAAIIKLGKENNFSVEATSDAGYFIKERLKKYAAVIFLSTTGNVLNENQQVAFERYIRAGGGFVGIHSATDTEYDWPWYNKLVGAYFANHPKLQTATIKVIDKNHPSTFFLPDKWERFDEWYNFKSVQRGIKILTRLDETTYTGGTMGDNHPFAWYHHFDGGRAFYTAGGHTKESYRNGLFLRHLLGGIVYAMGKNASPVIKITNPANNAVYYAPATINIKAKALDTDGAITKVRFYNGTTLLKSDIKSPYSVSWSNVPAGTYYLKAKATDNFGLSTTSAIVRISVVAKTTIVSSKPGSTGNQTGANGPVRMKLYPNPVSNTLNLITEGLPENKRSTLVVLSSSGVVIKTMQLNNLNKVVQLDVSTMVSGVYTIKVSSGSKIVVKQFLKL